MNTIIPERLDALTAGEVTLDRGAHFRFEEGHCAMERSKFTSRETTPENFWSKVDTSENCWLWLGRTDGNGYGRVGFRGRTNVGAHRVAWAFTNGGLLPDEWVLHRCDNPPCVNPDHLFLGDVVENNRDRQRKGRTRGWAGREGIEHHAFKVDAGLVELIHQMRQDGASQQAIADTYGVSRGHVSKILSGQTSASRKGLE